MMGSNGGHHTKWMVEDFPGLYDGGIAGYGFNSQVSQWGSNATMLRNYDVIAPRIDDIIAKRMGNQSQFDGAANKLRMLADRRPGEAHPLDVGAAAVARYFKIESECAQAVRLKLLAR